MNKKLWKTAVIAVTALTFTAGLMPAVPQKSDISASAEETVSDTYSVSIKLMQFHSTEVSMGNASMNPEAHIVVNADGTAEIRIDMQSMTYLGQDGYLGWLKKVTKIVSENAYQYPTEVETLDAVAIEEYTNIYDLFNNPESEYADPIVEGKWYPKVLSIPIDFENQEDEILVQVYVPVMESIMQGGGTKFAVLDIDWDSLRKESGSSEEPTETTESETTDTTEETSTTETTIQTETETSETETTATEPTAVTPSDYDNLEDGKYELQAEMIKADRTSYSMSNNGINHTVQLEVINGEYFLTVQFKGLAIYNQFGYLQDLYYYNKGYTYNTYGQPEGSVTKAEVISTYDVVDQYNSAEKLYPELLKFPLVDKAGGEYVPLRVFVPIMEAIADGTGTQNVLMKLDWSKLVKTSQEFQIEEQEEQSKAFDYTDDATGVKLHADSGVLPNDVTAEITAVSDGADYDTASETLENFRLYSVSVSSDLNGKMQISLPIDGISEPVVYRIADGKKTKINGTVADGYFTFSVKETGNYAIGSAITTTMTSTTVRNSTTTTVKTATTATVSQTSATSADTAPKTGDKGISAGITGLTIAGISTLISKRRKKK